MNPKCKFEVLPAPISFTKKKFGKNFTYQDVVDTYNVYNDYVNSLNVIMKYTNTDIRRTYAVPKYFKKFDYDFFFKALQLKTTAPEAISNYEKYFTKLTYNISVINYYFLFDSLNAFRQLYCDYISLTKYPRLSADALVYMDKLKHFIHKTMNILCINNIMDYSYADLMELTEKLKDKGINISIRYLAHYVKVLNRIKETIEHDKLYAKNFTRRKNAQKWSDIQSDKEIELAQENFDLAKRISELERENAALKSENEKLICEASTPTVQKLINKIKAKIR